jgi:ABC-type uncharacterized transport system substrate-binding protein
VKRTRFCIRACLLCALLSGAAPIALAEVHIEVGTEPTSELIALADAVRGTLAATPLNESTIDARVTIGAVAFRQALSDDDVRPIIAAFLTSTDFDEALAGRMRPPHVTAIFANPDPRDQLSLARALLGDTASIGVFDAPKSRALLARLDSGAVQRIPVFHREGIDPSLRAADSVDAILVLPDDVLTRANISHVVRSLYARRIVLIGHSATLVRVGSLASVYVPPESISAEIRSVLSAYAATRSLAAPRFVEEVDVAVNERLARSLNIVLPARVELLQSIKARRR